MQYGDASYAKSYIVAEFYQKSTLNNYSMQSIDPSIRHSLQEYWAMPPQEIIENIFFKRNRC